MRILWVKMGGLWPSTTGGRVRSLQTISELSRRHQVTVVTTHGEGDDPEGLARRLTHCDRVISLPYTVPKRGSAAFPPAVAHSWLTRYPVDLLKWRVPEVQEQVEGLMASGGVDLCIADFLFAAMNVPMGGTVPVVLFQHNVEYQIWQRLAGLERRPWLRPLFELEWRKMRAREADMCRLADLTIAVSDDDRRRLERLAPGIRAASIPTGVDTDYFTPVPAAERPGHLSIGGRRRQLDLRAHSGRHGHTPADHRRRRRPQPRISLRVEIRDRAHGHDRAVSRRSRGLPDVTHPLTRPARLRHHT